jgi:hypothetical protein
VRELIAALEKMRRRILTVITALEDGDTSRALEELDGAESEWRRAVEEIRS